jgi:tRNA(fMet)-specific endonuclease VapC
MPWLLDTNAWIHYLKDPASPIRIRLANVQPTDILTCSIVRAELLYGRSNTEMPIAGARSSPKP